MLNINKNQVLKNEFLNEYQRRVAMRLNLKGWNLPNKWIDKIKPIFKIIQKEGVRSIQDIRMFVKVVFVNFPRSKCMKMYYMKYPPIFLFKNKYSFSNFWDYKELQKSYIRSTNTEDDIVKYVKLQYEKTNCNKTGNPDIEKLKFAIVNGEIAIYTVAYVAILFDFSSELLNEINEYIKVAINDNFEKGYITIKNLIDKGAFK